MNGDAQALTGTASIAPEFVIGVTGHRDIRPEDDAGLRRDLKAALDEISGYLNDAPVRLACGMADGADMLAAEVALEMGIAVTAVLPMPQAEYEADFEAAALERFRGLLAQEGVRVLEIPMAGAPAGDAQVRDGQYKLLADYLTRRSNVLIAIWDGVDAGLAGGTSDVVQRYLADGRGQVPSEVAHDESAREGVRQSDRLATRGTGAEPRCGCGWSAVLSGVEQQLRLLLARPDCAGTVCGAVARV